MLTLIKSKTGKSDPKKFLLVFVFLTVILTLLATTFQFIYDRASYGLSENIHDGAIETEEAVKMLLSGKNPYTENYFNTPMENTPGLAKMDFANPALYHLVYLPFNMIFSIPFYLISNFFIHYFDERIVYIFVFFVFVAYVLKWPNASLERKLSFLTVFVANPMFFIFFVQGRNDIFVFTWLALAIYYLEKENFNLSAIALALAVSSKHSSWFILPFYFLYLYFKEKPDLNINKKLTEIINKTSVFFVTTIIFFVPFLVWDFNSFIDDTIKYPNGTTYMSYPITGFGFSQLLIKLGVINSPNEYWPFWIPQAIICIPLFYILIKIQKGNNTLAQIVFNLSIILMAFWLFSRFFNDNYIGFLIMLFMFSIFLIKKEKPTLPEKIFNGNKRKISI